MRSMIFNRTELLEVLRLTSTPIQENTTLPALQYICFRNNKAMTTNLQLSVICNVKENFTGLLPHKLLNSVLTNCESETVEITELRNSWLLKDGISTHKLGKSEALENFPAEPEFNYESGIELTEQDLFHLQNACKFEGVKTSGVEGCYIGQDIVGTNGTFIYKYNYNANTELHIPSLFVKSIGNNFGTLQFNERFAAVKSENCTYITTLLEAKYPAYPMAFQQFEIVWNIKMNAEVLRNEIKKILAYSPDIPVASFDFIGNECAVYFRDDFEHEYQNNVTCEAKYSGDIKLQVLQLQTILSCFTQPEIEIAIAAPNKSVYIRELNNQNTITLIQPSK